MNNKEFITQFASMTGKPANEASRLADHVAQAIATELENGEPVQMPGLGTLEVKKRMEREIVNPGTGVRMLVPPKLVVAFKPAGSLKDVLKKGGEL